MRLKVTAERDVDFPNLTAGKHGSKVDYFVVPGDDIWSCRARCAERGLKLLVIA